MARSDLFAAAAVRFMTVFSDPAHYGLIKNVLCSFQMKLLRQVFNGNEFFDRFPEEPRSSGQSDCLWSKRS